MKVRITGAGHETYWYADHIGDVFEVKRKPMKVAGKSYAVRKRSYPRDMRDQGDLYIGCDDCEIVTNTPLTVPLCFGHREIRIETKTGWLIVKISDSKGFTAWIEQWE